VLLENDCSLCRPVAETAIGLALASKLVSTEIIVADDYPELLSTLKVKILPFTVFGKQLTLEGHVSESSFIEMLFRAEKRKAAGVKCGALCAASRRPNLSAVVQGKDPGRGGESQAKGRKDSGAGKRHGSHNHS